VRRALRLALPGLLLPLLAGCFARPDHPVATSGPAHAPAAPFTGQAEPPPEPAALDLAGAKEALFRGLEDATGPLTWLRQRTTPPGTPPRLEVLSRMERAVLQRWTSGTPLGAVRAVAALGVSAHAPLPPGAMADLMLSAAVERQALGADVFRLERVEHRVPGHLRQVYRVEMLDRGEAIFTYDFRFSTVMERWDLPDGHVLLRYDPLPEPRPEHVTLYRGACLIEPAGAGSILTEFLILGTDVSVPFFLEGKLRGMSVAVFQRRVDTLWRTAASGQRIDVPRGR
jgi:hypothetical protein